MPKNQSDCITDFTPGQTESVRYSVCFVHLRETDGGGTTMGFQPFDAGEDLNGLAGF